MNKENEIKERLKMGDHQEVLLNAEEDIAYLLAMIDRLKNCANCKHTLRCKNAPFKCEKWEWEGDSDL